MVTQHYCSIAREKPKRDLNLFAFVYSSVPQLSSPKKPLDGDMGSLNAEKISLLG